MDQASSVLAVQWLATPGSWQAAKGTPHFAFIGTPSGEASVTKGQVIPGKFQLEQNCPNPFSPSTTIKCELPESSEVRLSVYDMLGREVSVLVNERRNAGVYEVEFDASELASGVYLYWLQAGAFVQSRKLLVLR